VRVYEQKQPPCHVMALIKILESSKWIQETHPYPMVMSPTTLLWQKAIVTSMAYYYSHYKAEFSFVCTTKKRCRIVLHGDAKLGNASELALLRDATVSSIRPDHKPVVPSDPDVFYVTPLTRLNIICDALEKKSCYDVPWIESFPLLVLWLLSLCPSSVVNTRYVKIWGIDDTWYSYGYTGMLIGLKGTKTTSLLQLTPSGSAQDTALYALYETIVGCIEASPVPINLVDGIIDNCIAMLGGVPINGDHESVRILCEQSIVADKYRRRIVRDTSELYLRLTNAVAKVKSELDVKETSAPVSDATASLIRRGSLIGACIKTLSPGHVRTRISKWQRKPFVYMDHSKFVSELMRNAQFAAACDLVSMLRERAESKAIHHKSNVVYIRIADVHMASVYRMLTRTSPELFDGPQPRVVIATYQSPTNGFVTLLAIPADSMVSHQAISTFAYTDPCLPGRVSQAAVDASDEGGRWIKFSIFPTVSALWSSPSPVCQNTAMLILRRLVRIKSTTVVSTTESLERIQRVRRLLSKEPRVRGMTDARTLAVVIVPLLAVYNEDNLICPLSSLMPQFASHTNTKPGSMWHVYIDYCERAWSNPATTTEEAVKMAYCITWDKATKPVPPKAPISESASCYMVSHIHSQMLHAIENRPEFAMLVSDDKLPTSGLFGSLVAALEQVRNGIVAPIMARSWETVPEPEYLIEGTEVPLSIQKMSYPIGCIHFKKTGTRYIYTNDAFCIAEAFPDQDLEIGVRFGSVVDRYTKRIPSALYERVTERAAIASMGSRIASLSLVAPVTTTATISSPPPARLPTFKASDGDSKRSTHPRPARVTVSSTTTSTYTADFDHLSREPVPKRKSSLSIAPEPRATSTTATNNKSYRMPMNSPSSPVQSPTTVSSSLSSGTTTTNGTSSLSEPVLFTTYDDASSFFDFA
jgi:hypothetical protein